VFLSSVKVLGDVSIRPLRVDDPYAPGDAYGRSKVKAEQSLLEAQMRHPEISLVILRIPLVYGPGVKANFRTLLRWAARGRRGFVLPFGRARSPRSIISVRNLCDALSASIGHRGIFHCADATDVSVAELFEKLGVPASRLLPVPAWIMRLMLTACGRSAFFERLYLPLQLDTGGTSSELGWEPGHPTDRELAELIMETDA
jgi:UDP-glucose 4-epimerase